MTNQETPDLGARANETMAGATALRSSALIAFEELLGQTPGVAVIHSSLPAIASGGGFEPWDILFAVSSLIAQGWTLAFPAFTFSFCRGADVDLEKSPSETGVLADLVRTHFPQARRSSQPIYSFVVVGPRAGEILDCNMSSAFGTNSQFAYFHKINATVVMLGCGWDYCTQFHHYEQLANVPYRLHKTFKGKLRGAPGGEFQSVETDMFVRDLGIGATNDFAPLIKMLQSDRDYREAAFWNGTACAIPARSIAGAAQTLLARNPYAFVGNEREAKLKADQVAEALAQPAFKTAILGHGNVDLLTNAVSSRLHDLLPERRHEIYTPGFGAISTELLDAKSGLASFNASLILFASRLEDLLGISRLEVENIERARDAVKSYAMLLGAFVARSNALHVICTFAASGLYTAADTKVISNFVEEANRTVENAIGQSHSIAWIDAAGEAASGIAIADDRLWSLGRIAFAPAFASRLADITASIAIAKLAKSARLLVLDLDHTLWGGVLGEDGFEGIKVAGDFPANAFNNFQRCIKSLAEKGIALAICSKNDDDLAIKVLREHSGMVIRESDISARRINWSPKWQNIDEIAAELSLGHASILFIDDNPVERESVKRNLPGVKILELPQDPSGYVQALLHCPWVNIIKVEKEDLQRRESYRARAAITAQKNTAASMDDFLMDLGMQLHIKRLAPENVSRAAQLCQKTNQFNTTTRRYSAGDLQQMAADGADVAVIGLGDRFTAPENIGLVVLKPPSPESPDADVDLLLLSCRVMGRQVEYAMLDWAQNQANSRGRPTLTASIVETPRNTPVRGIFDEAGFARQGSDLNWQKPVDRATLYKPWFTVTDEFETPEPEKTAATP